jgi:hypothetical protein
MPGPSITGKNTFLEKVVNSAYDRNFHPTNSPADVGRTVDRTPGERSSTGQRPRSSPGNGLPSAQEQARPRALTPIVSSASEREPAPSARVPRIEGPPLRVTTATVPYDGDLTAACQAEFGSLYRVADWTEVTAAMASGAVATRIVPATVGSALATRSGAAYASFPRHYIISSVIDAGYAAYDSYTASGGTMWLGAWNGNYQVLCHRP